MQCAFAILPSVPWPAVQYFSMLSDKWHNYQKKFIEYKMCVSIFSTTFVWNVIF